MTQSCHIRRLVEEVVLSLTETDNPALITGLGTFLHGRWRGGGSDQEEEEAWGEEMPPADPALMSCGFIPVAIVTDAIGGSRVDHMFGPSSHTNNGGLKSKNTSAEGEAYNRVVPNVPSSGSSSGSAALARSFTSVMHINTDADVGPFTTTLIQTVKGMVKTRATLELAQIAKNMTSPITEDLYGDGVHMDDHAVPSSTALLAPPPSILIVCRCSDGSSVGGAGSSKLATARGGTDSGSNTAAVRRIAMIIAQTATRIVLGAEGASSAGKALSYAYVGHEGCCPALSVLISAASDNAAVQYATPMVRQQCLGSHLRVFNSSSSSDRASTRSPTTAAASASMIVPLPVAKFLFKIIPSIPIIIGKEGLTRLLQSWFASLRLSDVGAMFVSMVMPFEHLRAFAADIKGKGAGGAAQSPLSSRAEQFTANIPLIQALIDHCTVVACSPSLDGPTAALDAQARAFGSLYARICLRQWEDIRKATLYCIMDPSNRNATGGIGRAVPQTTFAAPPLPSSPSPATMEFGHLDGSKFVAQFEQSIIELDISHISIFGPSNPTYFPAIAAPQISLAPELVKNLLSKVSIVVGSSSVANVGADAHAERISKKARVEGADADAADEGSYDNQQHYLEQASKYLERNRQQVAAPPTTAKGVASTSQPTMVFSDDFFSSAISDATRLLYVLVCRELQGGASAWVPLAQLCLMCCFGDELRCLRALHHLGMCRVVVVRPAKGDARSRCLV